MFIEMGNKRLEMMVRLIAGAAEMVKYTAKG